MAASNMSDIKRRIRSVTSTEHITNAMKLVSAAKLRRAKTTLDKVNENFEYLTATINDILSDTSDVPQDFLEGSREIVNTCYIVITSDRGLCGSYNSNVIKEAEKEIGPDKTHAHIIAIGSKGEEYFTKRGVEIHSDYLAPPEDISFAEVRDMCYDFVNMYTSGQVDKVVMIYTYFKNNMEQEVVSEQILPFYSRTIEGAVAVPREVEYEPSVEAVFNYLIPKYFEVVVYNAIVQAATSEHASRRMAMESATDSANDMLSQLSLYYNRARQASITNEIIEVVSGSEAQS